MKRNVVLLILVVLLASGYSYLPVFGKEEPGGVKQEAAQTQPNTSTCDFIREAANTGGFRVLQAIPNVELVITNVNTRPAAQWVANADGTRLMTWFHHDTGGGKNQVWVWDLTSGSNLFTLQHDDVSGAAWNPSEDMILTWPSPEDQGKLKTIDYEGGAYVLYRVPVEGVVKEWALIKPGPGRSSSQFIDPSNPGKGVIEWEGNWRTLERIYERLPGTVRIWDANTGNELPPITQKTQGIVSAGWNPDGTRIITLTIEGIARVFDVATRKDLLTLNHNPNALFTRAIWSPDGAHVVIWARLRSKATVWNAATGDVLLTLDGENQRRDILDVSWSQDNTRFLTVWTDGSIQIWSVATGKELLTLNVPHPEAFLGASWNIAGTHIVTWSKIYAAQVWDAATGKVLLTLDDTESEGVAEFGAIWSSDGMCILTWGGIDGAIVTVWDAATGKKIMTIRHNDLITFVMWLGNGTRILTWSYEESLLRVWGKP